MFSHYFKIAVRHLRRQPGYTLINVCGLAVGMACFILIFIYVQYELSYDRYHEKADRIFRLIDGANAKTSPSLLSVLRRNFPEIVNAVRIRPPNGLWLMRYGEKVFYEERAYYAEPNLFEMFDFHLIEGDPRTALDEPSQMTANSIVVSASMARKYFGDEDPMGKIITVGERTELTVTGVMRDIPPNSHFIADCFVSTPPFQDVWWWSALYTYILLPDAAQAEDLQQKINAYVDAELGVQARAAGVAIAPRIQPLTDIHLRSHLQGEADANSDITYVYILSSIGVILLLIACINYMNLATAQSVGRAREVGLRKVVGAARRQLMRQFIGESLVFAAIALLLALLLVALSMPLFNVVTGQSLPFYLVVSPVVWAVLAVMTLAVGLTAGSYPALFLSAFQPVDVLKGTVKIGLSGAALRKLLVATQLTLSIILIIGTGVVDDQLDYVRNRPLGYDKEHVVVIPTTIGVIHNQYAAFRNVLSQSPDILGVTRANSMPARAGGRSSLGAYLVHPEGAGEDEKVEMQNLRVEPDFLETLGVALVAGRDFTGRGLEWNDPGVDRSVFILNETAVAHIGWPSPEAAIGKQLDVDVTARLKKRGAVIGVVRDFHMGSLHQRIEPMLIEVGGPSHFAIRVRPGGVNAAVPFIRDAWAQVYPDYPFVYSFLDEDFDRLHQGAVTLGRLIGIFAAIAVLIACLGLFGLTAYTAEQRTREIGIRKVMGASVPWLMRMLSRDVALLALLANAIAYPLAYVAMSRWLAGFAYRTDIAPETFLAGSVLVLVIALATVAYRAQKAARANPVDALRYE